MRSPTSTDCAIRRAGPRGARTLTVLAILSLLALTAVAAPGPFLWGEVRCPSGVFPLRMATFQEPPGAPLDLEGLLERSEFRDSRPSIGLGGDFGSVRVVVLAYVGARATSLTIDVIAPDGSTTWTQELPIAAPHPDPGEHELYPQYVVAVLPRDMWQRAFPVGGMYRVVARGIDGPDGHRLPDERCTASTSVWLVVSR